MLEKGGFMEFYAAKCPSCGGSLQIPTDSEKLYCTYCGSTIIARAAIEFGRMEVTGTVSITEKSSASYIERANQFMQLDDYQQAFSIFQEASKMHPGKWEIWWGMICSSTENLSPWIDNRENTEKWYGHFIKTFTDTNIETYEAQYHLYLGKIREEECKIELERCEESLPKTTKRLYNELEYNKLIHLKNIRSYNKFVVLNIIYLLIFLTSVVIILAEISAFFKVIAVIAGLFTFHMLANNRFYIIKSLLKLKNQLERTQELLERQNDDAKSKIRDSEQRIIWLKEEIESVKHQNKINTEKLRI